MYSETESKTIKTGEKMNYITRHHIMPVLALLLALTIFNACQRHQQYSQPIAVALLYDVSMPPEHNGSEALDPETIDRLMSLLQTRGGVITVYEIEAGNPTLSQLKLLMESAKADPRQSNLTGEQDDNTLARFRMGMFEETGIFFAVFEAPGLQRITVFLSAGTAPNDPGSAPPIPSDLIVVTHDIPREVALEMFGSEALIFPTLQEAFDYL